MPPIADAGLPGYDFTTWYGVLAPAGLDPAIVDLLNHAMSAAVQDPDVADRLVAEGFEPNPDSPSAFAALIKAEIAKDAKIIAASGARIE